ncbi:MAG: Flp pilus assembly complex ATPase component TadA, partial [Epulopiscium sp.]|nr:Flp pilus assembly complex ATPase component TadA [Candidatus Epulonipiscium sp.]
MEEQYTIEGVVEDIIYSNEENGYTVCSVQTEDGEIVCVGTLPGVHPGENLSILGTWKVHPTYGEQLQITAYEKSVPKTELGIEKYLASGVIKGIGPTLAKRIVKKFGTDTLQIIEEETERLEEVKGISLKKAQEIGSIFHQQRELRTAMLFLQDYGISPTYALKIYKKYQGQTMDVVRLNPYRLADDIFGIGFKMADQIAASVGIEKESEHRIKSGIKYVLNEAAGSGHTYLPEELLLHRSEQLLQVSAELMENALIDLHLHKQIWRERVDEEKRVYLMPFYYAEQSVSKKILELASLYEAQDSEKIQKRIGQIEKEQQIELAVDQRKAIQAAMESGVLIITGGPGTGKTTTINTMIALLQEEEQEVILAAPTGRAAKRMTEATGVEAQTIHRLLEIAFLQEDSRNQMFQKNEEDPLEADVVIIDETSMVDILLMNSLLKAIAPGTRLILVGDMDQLPSVGPGNVLKDLILSGCVPAVRLTEIFRQAGESAIVTNA